MGLLRSLLGIGADELTPGQMALRAALTFIVTVVAVRLGHKRLFGKATAFDLVIAIMVGSVMSRKSAVSRLDLDEAMRREGSEPDLSRIRLAYLERDGSISMVPRKGEARVLEVTVEDNVQVVRIALG